MALKERAGGSLKTRFALNKGDSDFSKNTGYRFLNSYRTNWIRFTSLLAKAVISYLKNLTDANRSNVFIVDDSTFERNLRNAPNESHPRGVLEPPARSWRATQRAG